MKELSIEEKAKRYDEALKVLHKYDGVNIILSQSLKEKMFPELKESEDDRKKRMLHSIASKMSSHLRDIFTEEEFQCFDSWSYAWLEKKSEQKSANWLQELEDKLANATPKQLAEWKEKYFKEEPTEWSEEDERIRQDIESLIYFALEDGSAVSPATHTTKEEAISWIQFLKDRVRLQPWQEWTKEDKERYVSCLQRLSTGNPEQPETINSKWFKEHVYPKPQSTWRPSDRQIEILKDFLFHIPKEVSEKVVLVSLYHDLLKLKG